MRWLLAAVAAIPTLLAGANTPPIPTGLDTYLPAPPTNPITRDKAALGRALFRDPILSRDRTVACATCHDAATAFTDKHPLAIGIQDRRGDRRSPTIINRAFGKAFFWDGRARSLEEQVLQPITNPKEMDLTLSEAVARLRDSTYAPQFQQTFQRPPTQEDLAKALATYVRTILAGDSPYDRYMAGKQEALSPQAQAGLRLFRGKAACLTCHVGVNFSDERLHNTGLGAFKTPTLRQVADRPPYLHNGSLATLEDVIDFYDKGGKPHPDLDPELHPLHLTPDEKAALAAFLRSLSGRIQDGPW
jgi:cytochrome c peroxidase